MNKRNSKLISTVGRNLSLNNSEFEVDNVHKERENQIKFPKSFDFQSGNGFTMQ